LTIPKTPKLGLNKIDRSSPATTTYNLKTYHDDVMDTLDAAVGSPGGIASLDADGKVSREQLPSSGQPFDGGNSAVAKVNAVILENDTRNTVLTYTSGKLTKVEEKDGATIIKTTSMSFNATNGKLETIVEGAGGVTVTTTLTYDGSGTLTGTAKVVS
jgi:hypothetical protein